MARKSGLQVDQKRPFNGPFFPLTGDFCSLLERPVPSRRCLLDHEPVGWDRTT